MNVKRVLKELTTIGNQEEALSLTVTVEELLLDLVVEETSQTAIDMFLWGGELLREAQQNLLDTMVAGKDSCQALGMLREAGNILMGAFSFRAFA